MNLLETDCLKISSLWIPVGKISVRQAFSDAAAGASGLLYLDEGYPVVKSLEEWLELPVGVNDDYIGTGGHFHGEINKVRVPRVSVTVNFDRPKSKDQKFNLDNLWRRYKEKDAVTGKPLPRNMASREHVKPRSLGGEDGWSNEVPMHRKANSKRGNKSYIDAGLPEPKILGAPPPLLPINTIINIHGYPEWELFKIPRI